SLSSLFATLASKSPTSSALSRPFFEACALPPAFVGNYSLLLGNVFERRRLQLLDQGGEKKLGARELTRRSAARSGFVMPDVYDEDGGGGGVQGDKGGQR
ncbi:hypothetical protein TeGR_g2906, partial [Tetraparma gracilis]